MKNWFCFLLSRLLQYKARSTQLPIISYQLDILSWYRINKISVSFEIVPGAGPAAENGDYIKVTLPDTGKAVDMLVQEVRHTMYHPKSGGRTDIWGIVIGE